MSPILPRRQHERCLRSDPDITHLYDRLVDTHFDPNDATKTVPKKPEIWGSFDPKYGQTVQTPDSTQGTYKNGITVDEDRWLIITEDQLYSVSNGKYSPANIQVKIAYSVRDSDTWEFFRYTQDLQLSSAVPTQPRIIRHEDIFGKSVGTFDNNFDLTDFTDNTDSDDLNAEANYYLQAAAQEYIEQDSLDVPYAGLVPIQVDGLIQQVTYSISSGPGGSTMTRASLATEHNPYVLPWSVRRRNEKAQRRLLANPIRAECVGQRTGGFSRDARPSAVDVSTKCNAMPQELSSRFAGRIRWIGFENQSGQDIPPYSIIEASGWQMPDPSGSDVSVTSPIVLGEQPGDPINPYACYITGAASVPAGGNGVCARPTLDLPLLVSLFRAHNKTTMMRRSVCAARQTAAGRRRVTCPALRWSTRRSRVTRSSCPCPPRPCSFARPSIPVRRATPIRCCRRRQPSICEPSPDVSVRPDSRSPAGLRADRHQHALLRVLRSDLSLSRDGRHGRDGRSDRHHCLQPV